MKATQPICFFWFRRDLRIHDNHGLFQALKSSKNVVPVFIFDTQILQKLNHKTDKRIQYIYNALKNLKTQFNAAGSDILVEYGSPTDVWNKLLKENPGADIYTNEDYEPYALERDKIVQHLTSENGGNFYSFKDQVIMRPGDVLKDDGTPYTVYTPFSKKWKLHFRPEMLQQYPSEKHLNNLYPFKATMHKMEEIGFEEIELDENIGLPNPAIIQKYGDTRDFPSIKGTSRMSVHLRFGTISVRELMNHTWKLNEKYINELIWREFYMHILFFFPHVASRSFKPQYDRIEWRNNATEFEAWCKGQTGYPIVDAGMRELNATGFMHNRVRMIVASFLTKHLLIDWRWGEAYFAEKLMDFELASNNGGWQWAAGSGVDAAPYFRVFNPALQTAKFDPQFLYIKKWVPEIMQMSYTKPIVQHEFARKRCLEVYKAALSDVDSASYSSSL